MRRLRVIHFNSWAAGYEDAAVWLERVPALDLSARVTDARDPRLERMARLDCDWHAEVTRCFAALAPPSRNTSQGAEVEFLPAQVTGAPGLAALLAAAQARPLDETWWLVLHGQTPQSFAPLAGKLLGALKRIGVRVLFYAFDEASRTMACFRDLAPHLDVLIHDEAPLDPANAAALSPRCRTVHRSWVANFPGGAVPLRAEVESKILFLGSQLGLTPHRQRQLDHLRARFQDRLVAIHNHSVAVADRADLARYAVGFCPEGRKFNTPAMSATHTDRPFWCGCLGLVPVSEDSSAGGRLEELHRAGLIVRYPHGDLRELTEACERALAWTTDERRRVWEHFNQHETIGAVVAEQLAAAA